MGAWISYGLGSPNKDLPAYVVMISRGPGGKQALYESPVGSRFPALATPGREASPAPNRSCIFRTPPASTARMRRRMLDRIASSTNEHFDDFGDPETQTRISQYEMAFRMQTSVP